MGLAVRDCSVSFGSEIMSPLFSYWYIKQYTYIRSDSFNISASWLFLETKSDNELEWCALVALFTAIQYRSHLLWCLQTSILILASYWSMINLIDSWNVKQTCSAVCSFVLTWKVIFMSSDINGNSGSAGFTANLCYTGILWDDLLELEHTFLSERQC